MKEVVVGQGGEDYAGAVASARGGTLRQWAAGFWLRVLFFLARRAPIVLRWGKPVAVFFAAQCSKVIQDVTRKNARRIYGQISDKERRAFTWRVTEHFYDFVTDVGRAMNWTPEAMRKQVVAVEGRERYDAIRAQKRGAIVATAHMGSFEVGLAALRESEANVHVVFRRDADDPFDEIRRVVRKRLDVIETPVDEGWGLWVRLRDALMRDEVVVIQGDRVMRGQKGQRVEFLGGHIMMPTGPAKLAAASGAPIVPIFSMREEGGKIRIIIEDAIEAGDEDATVKFAKVLEKHVRAHGDQWLVLQAAFCEDVEASEGSGR